MRRRDGALGSMASVRGGETAAVILSALIFGITSSAAVVPLWTSSPAPSSSDETTY